MDTPVVIPVDWDLLDILPDTPVVSLEDILADSMMDTLVVA